MSDSGSTFGVSTLRLFWQILRFRRGPEDVPVSFALLATTFIIRVGLGLLVTGAIPQPASHAMALIVIDSLILLVWGKLVLQIARHPERFLQTMTAIFGCELLLQFFAGPASWAFAASPEGSAAGQFAVLLVYALGIWALIATVRILRSATGWPLSLCIAVVIGQEFLTLIAAVLLFPDILTVDNGAAAGSS